MIVGKSSVLAWLLGTVGGAVTVWGWTQSEIAVVGLGITTLGGAGIWTLGAWRRQNVQIERAQWQSAADERDRITGPYDTRIARLGADLETERERRIKAEERLEWMKLNPAPVIATASTPTPTAGSSPPPLGSGTP